MATGVCGWPRTIFLPKRVSVWNDDGTLWKAFYGPGKYGGGGTLDSNDPTRFLFSQPTEGTLEFKLDWQTGRSRLANVLVRKQAGDMELPFRAATPRTALSRQRSALFDQQLQFQPDERARHGADLSAKRRRRRATCRGAGPRFAVGFAAKRAVQSGLARRFQRRAVRLDGQHGDAHAQPDEVRYRAATSVDGITVMPDLSFAVARVDGAALRFAPSGFNGAGAPQYNLAGGEKFGGRRVAGGFVGRLAGFDDGRAKLERDHSGRRAVCGAVRSAAPKAAWLLELSEFVAGIARLTHRARTGSARRIAGHDANAGRVLHAARLGGGAVVGAQFQHGQRLSVHRRRTVRLDAVSGFPAGPTVVDAGRRARHRSRRADFKRRELLAFDHPNARRTGLYEFGPQHQFDSTRRA